MTIYRFTASLPILFLIILLALSGCFKNEPVRHLSSDISLIIPGHTTRKKIISFMGSPAVQEQGLDSTETWIYYQVHKSFMREVPRIGHRFGYEEYDVVMITFFGDIVRDCQYRLFSEERFRDLGIPMTGETEKE
ncbi:MAG: hypothetical protein U9O82_02230 [Thermodesulfobacteriota bacterium]|nr:hypothetical protein [Thermodesulfobacteriota bacterium]